jgi:hypothetical protein
MASRIHRKTYIILFIICFILESSAFAQDARLADIIVINTRDDLLVYLNVEGAFREKLKKAVLSGVPTTFSFYVALYKTRNWWMDKEIADIKITNTVKYDNLKKEFVVKRSWVNSEPMVTQSFEEAQKQMAEVDSLKIVPLNMLEKGGRYQLRAKAELSKVTLPLYLHYVLVFVSLWDFETDWYTVDFIY